MCWLRLPFFCQVSWQTSSYIHTSTPITTRLLEESQGAAYKYELDLWQTCYKELTQQINANEKGQVNVYVDSGPGLVQLYANKNITVVIPAISFIPSEA